MKYNFWTFAWVASFFKWAAGAFEDQKGMVSGKRLAGYYSVWLVGNMVKDGFLYPAGKDMTINMYMFWSVLGFAGLCFGLAMMEWFAMVQEKKNALVADAGKPETVKLAEIKVEQTKAENPTAV